MDFVENWLSSLGLGTYTPWFRDNKVDTADRLVAWASLPKAELEGKIEEINTAYPDGVLTNAYGHGALFRSSLVKVSEKIRQVAGRARFQLDATVGVSESAKDDENDAFGPLKPGMFGVVVDVAFPKQSTSATFKVRCDDGTTWWYNETSLVDATRPAPPTVDPTPEPVSSERDAAEVREERLSTNAIVTMAARLRTEGPVSAGQPPLLPPSAAAHREKPDIAASDPEVSGLDTTRDEQRHGEAAVANPAPTRDPEQQSQSSSQSVPVVSSGMASLVELEDLTETEDGWIEAEISQVAQSGTADENLTLPKVSLQLAKLAGLQNEIETRHSSFGDRARELTAAVQADPQLAAQLSSLTEAITAVRERFQTLDEFVTERKTGLEKIKTSRMAKMRRNVTPPTPSVPQSPTYVPTSTAFPSPLESGQTSSLHPPASSEAVRSGTPAVAHATNEHLSRSSKDTVDSPLFVDSEDQGGPCVLAFNSINDRTLNLLLKTLGESTGVIAEYTILGESHVDQGMLPESQVIPVEYGQTVEAGTTIFFDIDVDKAVHTLASSMRGRRISVSAPPPGANANANRFHNVSAL